MMWITQEKYLEAANNNFKEWFEDNNYDIIFIPLVARDYLTAYLLNFVSIQYTAPDIDFVLDRLEEYNKEIVYRFKPLDIKFKEEVKDRDFYLNLLIELKEYVNKELSIINRQDFEWINKYSEFRIKDKIYNLQKDYPNNLNDLEIQLFEAINPIFSKTQEGTYDKTCRL